MSEEDITRKINSLTFHQVNHLRVTQTTNCIVIEGQCKSYYIKQIVSHVVMDLMPGKSITNDVLVN